MCVLFIVHVCTPYVCMVTSSMYEQWTGRYCRFKGIQIITGSPPPTTTEIYVVDAAATRSTIGISKSNSYTVSSRIITRGTRLMESYSFFSSITIEFSCSLQLSERDRERGWGTHGLTMPAL